MDPCYFVKRTGMPCLRTLKDGNTFCGYHVPKKFRVYSECSICLTAIKLPTSITETPCKHVFHKECLDKWITHSKNTCPLCRKTIAPPPPPPSAASVLARLEAILQSNSSGITPSTYTEANMDSSDIALLEAFVEVEEHYVQFPEEPF